MEPFIKPQAMQGVLSFMSPELLEALRREGFVLDCRKCCNSYFKQMGPITALQCVCGVAVDQSKEPWALPDYVPPAGATIPTVDVIAGKLYRMSDEKAEGLAEQLGLSRSAFYRLMAPGQPLPKRQTLLALADVCANRGLLAEAEAIERYWSRQRRQYRLRGKRMSTPEDAGWTPGFWESKRDERALAEHGIPPLYPGLVR